MMQNKANKHSMMQNKVRAWIFEILYKSPNDKIANGKGENPEI